MMRLENKKICITGGAGFIGHHLVRKLLGGKNKVLVLDNLSFGKKELLSVNNKNLIFKKVDIRDKKDVICNFLEFKPDVLIHLAAIHHIPYCNAHPAETADININGTRNVLSCEVKANVKKIFFASTMAVYPIREGPNREGSETGPIDIYGTTKLAGENIAELFANKRNIHTIVGRFSNVYGPDETNPHLVPEIERQIKNGKVEIELGNLMPKRDFIHTDDLTNAIITLLEGFESNFDVFNIGWGKEYSVKEVVQALEKAIGKRITIKQTKERMRKIERMHLLANISKIKNKTGWYPKIEFHTGIKRLFK